LALLVAIFFAVVIGVYGLNGMLLRWHIPYLVPHFADLASLTYGRRLRARGWIRCSRILLIRGAAHSTIHASGNGFICWA
jgi:hypothetical protein